MDKIFVAEIFGPTIQGEGALCGQATHFIRTFGCAYRCTWCDSMHAVDLKYINDTTKMTVEEISETISKLSHVPWVTISGGDPVIWDLKDLVTLLKTHKFKVAVETQGFVWRDWLEQCDLVTCSPKGPSSGMSEHFNAATLQKYHIRLGDKLIFKIVAFNDEDLDFAERVHKFLPGVKMFISSGTSSTELDVKTSVLMGYKNIIEKVLQRPKLVEHVTILPQLHTLVWERELGH